MCFGTCLRTSKVFKFSFIPFNVFMMVLCVSVLALSCVKLHVVGSYNLLTGGYATEEKDVSISFVVLASVELLLTVLGCLVALRQTANYVAAYFVAGVPLACALMSVAMYQLAGEAAMCDSVATGMLFFMNYYKDNYLVQRSIDRGQVQKACCGANSFKDWLSLPSNYSFTSVPKTCCLPHALFPLPSFCNLNVTWQETNHTLYNNIYDRGCVDAYIQELGTLPQDAGIIMTAIAVMQFGALVTIVLVYGKQFSESFQHARNRIV